MAGVEKEPEWTWGASDHVDTANSVARLFGGKEQKPADRPSRGRVPEGYFGQRDGADTADAVAETFGYHTASGIPSFMTEIVPEDQQKKEPEVKRVNEQVQLFYRHCAVQFFKHHYSQDHVLDDLETESERMALEFEEFRVNFGNFLKENRMMVTDDNLRADILVGEMDFDELFLFASSMVDYYVAQSSQTREFSLEQRVLIGQADFWDKVGTIISLAKAYSS